jgi:hypothetical protein
MILRLHNHAIFRAAEQGITAVSDRKQRRLRRRFPNSEYRYATMGNEPLQTADFVTSVRREIALRYRRPSSTEGYVRFPQFIGVTWLALMYALAPADAEKRIALVVGNNRYANLPAHEQLQKAVSDSRAVGGTLRQIGFDVISGENLGRQALLARLDETALRLTPGDTVFFFFSGHGVAVDGFNYILPADMPAVRKGQIATLTGAAIKEEDITAAFLRAGARVTVIVLDACRNNPFSSSGAKGIGGEKGLAPHEPPSGTFTFYAASRGEAALDRLSDDDRNPNSVFTRVLLPALNRADLDLPALAREVREEVTRLARSASYTQRPAYYDETSGDRIFLAGPGNGRPGGAAQSQSAGPAPSPTASGDSIEKRNGEETINQRQKIQCGSNAKTAIRTLQPPLRGWVFDHLTKAEASRTIQITQASWGMSISPDYIVNIRVRIHVDGTREGALSAASAWLDRTEWQTRRVRS